jgi:hypothetical protein
MTGDLRKANYAEILEWVFRRHHRAGSTNVEFTNSDIRTAAAQLRMALPRNPPDVIYSARYRLGLPDSVQNDAPAGMGWIIRGAGVGRYRIVAVPSELLDVRPSQTLAEVKIPDATPGVIAKYALNDEQALLARIRYNRMLDIFSGVACYSLQSHLKTSVVGIGQVEVDEVYVGVSKAGVHFVFPVEAKGENERLGVVQIEQDIALCAAKFPNLVCRPIGAQFMAGREVIALFEFEGGGEVPRVMEERHYRLVPPDQVTAADLERYRATTG